MKGHNLEVLGIQLTRHKDKANTIYTPQSKENVWLYAKMSVQSTDSAVSYHNENFSSENVSFSRSIISVITLPHTAHNAGLLFIGKNVFENL